MKTREEFIRERKAQREEEEQKRLEGYRLKREEQEKFKNSPMQQRVLEKMGIRLKVKQPQGTDRIV